MRIGAMSKSERIMVFAWIGIAVLVILAFNFLTWYLMDDYSYRFNFVTKQQIPSFSDIFQSLGIHYTNVNGRLVVHFFAHLFLWIGKPVFNVINTLAFCTVVSLLYYHICGSWKPFRPYLWLAMFLGVWHLTPAFGQSFLWTTGASNYLYGMLLILCYLLPFRISMNGEQRSRTRSLFLPPLMLLLGFFAGWTNENTSCAMIFFTICLIIWHFGKNRRIPVWMLTGFIGSVSGFLVMILAPGSLSRLSSSGGTGGLPAMLTRAWEITLCFFQYLWPLCIVWALLFLRFWLISKRNRDVKKASVPLLPLSIFYLLAGFASLYSMAVPPEMPNRVWGGPIMFFLISAGCLYRLAEKPLFSKTVLRLGVAVICGLSVIGSCFIAAPKLYATTAALTAREAEAARQISAGETHLILPPVVGSGSKYDAVPTYPDIAEDSSHWLNVALARYLGGASVISNTGE